LINEALAKQGENMHTTGATELKRGVIANRLRLILASVETDLLFWTGVGAAVAILMIPQVAAIFLQVEFEWESLWQAVDRGQAMQSLLLFLGFILYLDCVALFALASILYVVPPSWFSEQGRGLTPRAFQNHWPAAVSMLVVTLLGLLLLLAMGEREGLVLSAFLLGLMGLALTFVGHGVAWACSWLVRLNAKLTVQRRYQVAGGLALVAVLLFVLVPADSGWFYCLSGAALQGAAVLLLLVAAWLGLVNACRARTGVQSLIEALGRTLGWLVVVSVGGELVWILAGGYGTERVISYRLYTIWAVLELCALLIIVGSFLDTCDNRTRYPVRVVAILLLLAGLVLTRTTAPDTWPASAVPQAAASSAGGGDTAAEAWYAAFGQRIRSIPEGEPVLLVAASGGGSRAAIFAGLAMEALARTPCGAREGDHWARHVALISSVSGGSLATAQFVQRQGGELPEPRPELLNSIKSELLMRMDRAAQASHVRYQELHPTAADSESRDVQRRLRAWEQTEEICQRLVHGQPQPQDPAWVVQSGLMDDLCTDFMAPVLRGVWMPNLSRGESLRAFWKQRFGWRQSNDQTGYAMGQNPPQFDWIRHPLVAFNACEVLQGTRCVIGFPAIPDELVRSAGNPDREPHSLVDWEAGRAIELGQAVGMSANFPFGFNPIEIRTQGSGERPLILDGGMSDNTGLDTLYRILHNLQRLSQDKGRESVKNTWDALCARHVVILEIDSGAKPRRASATTRMLSTVAAPLLAFGQVGYVQSQDVKARYLQDMRGMLRHGVDLQAERKRLLDGTASAAAGPQPGVPSALATLNDLEAQGVDGLLHVKFECNYLGEDNVLTAWSLGPADKASLLVRFLNEQQLALDDLAQVPFTSPEQRRQQVLCAAAELVDSQLQEANLGDVARSVDELSRVVEQMAKLPPSQTDQKLEASWKQQLAFLRDRSQQVGGQLELAAEKTSEEAKALADKIETTLQRAPRSSLTLKELRTAAARLSEIQAKATKDAEAQIDREQTLQNRFDARVQQNRRDIRESRTAAE